jgi:hypothetical protein
MKEDTAKLIYWTFATPSRFKEMDRYDSLYQEVNQARLWISKKYNELKKNHHVSFLDEMSKIEWLKTIKD